MTTDQTSERHTPLTQADRAEAVLDAIRREYQRARTKHAPLHSGHEAVGVIDEEFVEFRDAVYFGVDRRGERSDPAREAIQVAAMALAYVVEAYASWEWHRTGEAEPEHMEPAARHREVRRRIRGG